MILLLTLLACWGEPAECTVRPDATELECEVDEDCVVVHLDCNDCVCGAVNSANASTIEDETPADCGTDECVSECSSDCLEQSSARCIRNECEVFADEGDTFGG